MDPRCFICTAASEATSSLPWYDVPVHRVDGVGLTLLGVGAIAPGYLLVCPQAHVSSLAAMPPDAITPFLGLVATATAALERQFGTVLLFEHGGCAAGDRASSCVEHAHLHLWAVADRVTLRLVDCTAHFADLAGFLADAGSYRSEPYLLHSDRAGTIHVGRDIHRRQFFRRHVAAQLGRPDEWDYAGFGFEQHMLDTRDRLRAVEGHGRDQ